MKNRAISKGFFLTAAGFLLATAAASALPGDDVGKLGQVESIATKDQLVEVINLADGLVHPWGLAQFPVGRMLVTERPRRLRIVR